MDKQKVIKILNILNLIVFILFFILFITLPKSNCGVCSFEFEDKEIKIKELLNINFERCPVQTGAFPQMDIDISNFNISS